MCIMGKMVVKASMERRQLVKKHMVTPPTRIMRLDKTVDSVV
jgi:hypothetical protein